MAYQNRYRDYLSNERPNQRYLSDDYINGEVKQQSTGRRMVAAGSAVALAAGVGWLGWKSGALRGVIRSGMKFLADREGSTLKAAMGGLREFAERDLGPQGLFKAVRNLPENLSQARSRMTESVAAHTRNVERMSGSRLRSVNHTEIEQFLSEAEASRRSFIGTGKTAVEQGASDETFRRLLKQHMDGYGVLDAKAQQEMLRTTGVRHATLAELMPELQKRWGSVDPKQGMSDLILRASDEKMFGKEFLNRRADPHIFIDEAGQIMDLRGARKNVKDVVKSLEQDFQVPFVGLNPLRMFRTSEVLGLDEQPLVHMFARNSIQSAMTGEVKGIARNIVYMNGKAIDMDMIDEATGQAGKVIREGGYLMNVRSGQARLLRRMQGTPLTEHTVTQEGPRSWYAALMEKMDLGFQDEPMRGATRKVRHEDAQGNPYEENFTEFSWFDPFTWGDRALYKLKENLWRPYETSHVTPRHQAFTDPSMPGMVANAAEEADGVVQRQAHEDWLWMNTFKTPTDGWGFFRQLNASRKSLDQVSTGTFLPISPYVMMDRLEGYFARVGLGASVASTGSATDIFKFMMMKRVAPVVGAGMAWKYFNYESENLFGEGNSPNDLMADAYVGASVDLAKFRDSMGWTDWAKHKAFLFPGGHHISELPFVGNLFRLNKSAEETEDYWKNGEDPMRKGRWWELGNTPYVGGKVDYFRPNWYRRQKANVEMTDSLYGSEDEYWRNHWLPTPRYPLAPLRHFLFNSKWLEEKHEKDRPYPITGGIPLIEEFPLIGPVLQAQYGRFLKTPARMHMDEMASPGQEVVPGVAGVAVPARPGKPSVVMPVDQAGTLRQEAVAAGNPMAEILNDTQGQYARTVAYITASGDITPMSYTGNETLSDLDSRVRSQSAAAMGMTLARPSLGAPPDATPVIPDDPSHAMGQLQAMGSNINNLYGFYSFAAGALANTDEPAAPRMATSRAMSSWRRSFQDMNLGGRDFLFGGEVSEVIRRFFPREKFGDDFNPIRNTQPLWLPGQGAWTDFQHGDPYVKVANGEERLPGAGYEALNGIPGSTNMSLTSSALGLGEMDMVRHILQTDDVTDPALIETLGEGKAIHRHVQKGLKDQGILIDSGVKVEVKNDPRAKDISGLYDGRIRDETSPTGQAMVEIKSQSAKNYANNVVDDKHIDQLNYYLAATGNPVGYLYYADRDNPKADPHVHRYEFDPERWNRTMQRVQNAREFIKTSMESGSLNRGDFYSPLDRFRVLADVAPYSQEFRDANATMSKLRLPADLQNEVRQIRQQVKEKRDDLQLTPRQFSGETQRERVTVTKVIDATTFMTAENPDNPIRLAGVKVISKSENGALAQQALDLVQKYIFEGAKLEIDVDADPLRRIKNDTYQTIGAAVYNQSGRSLGRELMNQKLGREVATDFSAPAVMNRFSPKERIIGRMWESVAHFDTPFNTKFLHVRSALENYERVDVYGKEWQTWDHPIRDYVQPTYESFINKHPIVATALGAWLGSKFGAGNKTTGKLIGGIIGGVIAGVGSLYRTGQKAITGEAWIPERRVKEREVNEYYDILKFLKFQGLAREYAGQAKEQEGFDVDLFVARAKAKGEAGGARRRLLQDAKRELMSSTDADPGKIASRLGFNGEDASSAKTLASAMNKELKNLAAQREVQPITPLAAKALQYQKAADQTAYGWDPGDSVQNALMGLSKREREYLPQFSKASAEERDRILQLAPRHMRRILESQWGLPVEAKPDPVEYFKSHYLPGQEWAGWRPEVNLDDVKIKFINHEGMDRSSFGLWQDDMERANREPTPVPKMFNAGDHAGAIQSKLVDILNAAGYEDVQVDIMGPAKGIQVDVDVRKDKQRELETWLNDNGGSLF